MIPAELHQALLESIADEVQLPQFQNKSGVERGAKILYFHNSEELSLALHKVQRKISELYPAKSMMNNRLEAGKKFQTIWKNYGFGAIVDGGGLVNPRREDRANAVVYIDRLVPGGFMLIWSGQFKSPSRFEQIQSFYKHRLTCERITPSITDLFVRLSIESSGLDPDNLPPYFIARKPQQ
ncbi:hypothetical protein GOV07_00700 [Candidatus Woesearchaeota archaeon]|nr:hypothetical protein [Candidatus Woesearchaeota archaeon]